MLKPSSYNYVTTLADGTTLFFNFYTLALIALDSSEAFIAQDLLANPQQAHTQRNAAELKQLFRDKGFLIDRRIDEMALLKSAHFNSRVRQNVLGLTIAPTINCNFRCTYCYENRKKEVMSLEVEEALIAFVRERIVKEGSFSVMWYGGEPLLCLDIIERLSKAFMDICRKKDVTYTASIVTNGYLLDEKTAEKLVSWQVKDAQITIDGPPEIHDERRPHVNGGKTFRKIMGNVKTAANQMAIKIRMNVDERNRDSVMDMVDILGREGLYGKVSLYLGHVYPYTDACSDVSGWCLNEEDFSVLGMEAALETIHRGLGGVGIPISRNHWCMADSEYAYVVTPSGGIAKCWNEVANPSAEVDHLLKPATAWMKKKLERWRCRDPFELECADCLLLPICMGGCPYVFERSGKLECHLWKHHIKERVCLYYLIKKFEQETEMVQEFRELIQYVKESA
jgi:uncharacterized protein